MTGNTQGKRSNILTAEALLGLREADMKRKGSQQGTLIQRSGSWVIRYSDHRTTVDGDVKYAETSKVLGRVDKMTKREAMAAARLVVDQANSLAACPQGLATVQQFVDARFRPEHIDRLKQSGQIFYESIMRRHILPTIGNMAVKDVQYNVIQRLITAKSQKYSGQTVKHIRNCISAIFRHAKRLKMYQGDLPTEGVLLPKLEHEQRGAMTWVQFETLVSTMPVKHRPLMRFLMQTGLRIGEATGLRWKRVNLTGQPSTQDGILLPARSIFVCDAVVRGRYTTPKTMKATRFVPLSAEAIAALEDQLQLHPSQEPDSPVFPGDRGKPLNSNNLQKRHIHKAAADMGEPWICAHALRHTFATMLHGAGASGPQRQAALGHGSVSMSDHYTHADLEDLRSRMEAISGAKHGQKTDNSNR